MTDIDILDETEKYSSLADQIRSILTAAAPLVEQITGLMLPAITYCLTDPQACTKAIRTYLTGAADRDAADHQLTARDQIQLQRFPITMSSVAGTCWTLSPPTMVTDSLYRPQTLIIPDALAHQGVLDHSGALHELMIQPLVHAAQIAASKGAVAPPKVWPMENNRPSHPTQLLQFGHASWAAGVVAPAVLGAPIGNPRLRRSGLYRLHALPELLNFGRGERTFRRAERFVTEAVAGCGVSRFNRVWTTPGLVPTSREFTHPDEWLRRTAE